MTESVASNGQVLAYIVRGTPEAENTEFHTPDEIELQAGFIVYSAGNAIAPHKHAQVSRNIDRHCEVIVVRKGCCEVDIFDEENDLVATHTLRMGDLAILVSGGHGFRMLEDTILLEVKQGPYYGPQEKVLLP